MQIEDLANTFIGDLHQNFNILQEIGSNSVADANPRETIQLWTLLCQEYHIDANLDFANFYLFLMSEHEIYSLKCLDQN